MDTTCTSLQESAGTCEAPPEKQTELSTTRAAACTHQLAVDTSSPACNAFAPTGYCPSFPCKAPACQGCAPFAENRVLTPTSQWWDCVCNTSGSLAIGWPEFMVMIPLRRGEPMGCVTEQKVLSCVPTHGVWREEGDRAEPASTRSVLLELWSHPTFPGARTPGMSGWHP